MSGTTASRVYLIVWLVIAAVILAGFYASGGKVQLWMPPIWLAGSLYIGYSAGRMAS